MKNLFVFLVFISALVVLNSCEEGDEPTSGRSEVIGDSGADGFSLSAGGSAVAPGGGPSAMPATPPNQSGVITAGEWNDLDHWDFWEELMTKQEFSDYTKDWGIMPVNRYSFLLQDANQNVLVDATVKITDSDGNTLWEARTDNQGKAEAWLNLFSHDSEIGQTSVVYRGKEFILPAAQPFDKGINTFTTPISTDAADAVDVMLVVDATGSMGDELEYLKKELEDVLTRSSQTQEVHLKTACVFYRDKDDEYVTRSSAFTSEMNTTINFVKEQSAGGGGDLPEAVHSALENAINQQTWSVDAKARLLFLILDAPPHSDHAVKENIRVLTKLASAKGIKIIPITASGINKSTEFLMRAVAAATNGTYVFITNHSGIGNEHIEATVGEFEVEFLNNLMVRLIKKYAE